MRSFAHNAPMHPKTNLALASLLALNVSFVAVSPVVFGQAADTQVVVEPKEIDALFASPGMGWQTFHHFADEDRNLDGLPSASAYFRFYWREVEPRDGAIDFAKFDDLLVRARRAGQKLAFRIMCTGSGQYMDVPPWLKEQGCKGTEFTYGGRKHWVPDFSDPLFKKAHFRLIAELGRWYDGHPDMDLLDIGSVGLWGEWHMSGTKVAGTDQPVGLPTVEERLEIIDAWRKAFPHSSKVMLIGSDDGMARAAASGYGWRADCLGDMGGFSKTWNHMKDFYLQQLERTAALEVWKTAPVAFESCWDMRKWKEENWDIRYIFDYALRCHASYMNNKSAPIPEGTRAEVERFLRRMGYRLVLRKLEHRASVKAGEEAVLTMDFENVGVAPPYRDYYVGARLDRASDSDISPLVVVSDLSVRGWLPGRHPVRLSLRVPKGFDAGKSRVSVGVLDPSNKEPAVPLAIAGRAPDGWYSISQLEVMGSER